MVRREGRTVAPTGDIVPAGYIDVDERPLPLWRHTRNDASYIDRLRNVILLNHPSQGDKNDDDDEPEALGSIAPEEPSVGQMLECISAIANKAAPPTTSGEVMVRLLTYVPGSIAY